MCTIALAFHAHPAYPLVLASNRDEFYERPSLRAGFWGEHPDVLAGKDLRGGGTWLGVNLAGRFAALTNVRTGVEERPGAPSRGEIITRFLTGDAGPMSFVRDLAARAGTYNGFNLLLGDANTLILYSNRAQEPTRLGPGVYGISNAVPGTEWPKARRASRLLEDLLANGALEPEALLELLSDVDRPADHLLPDTGVGVEWERRLSPIFIQSPDYGTCASTVFIVDVNGRARFVERRHAGVESNESEENRYEFPLLSFADRS